MQHKQFGRQAALWNKETAVNMPDATDLLHQFFPHIPTEEQQNLFLQLGNFLNKKDKNLSAFILTGYAGTGKTSCLRALSGAAQKLGYRVLFLAPTGRAAKIISKYTQQKAQTLHRQLYQQVQHPFSGAVEFRLRKSYLKNCLFVVDEASMIGAADEESERDLLSDLIQFASEGSGNKLVLVGDPAQLPPVGNPLSPALHHEILQYVYNLPVESVQLKEVSRQQEGSGILENATALRNQLTDPEKPLKIQTHPYKDIFRMPRQKLEEGIRYAYQKYGINNSLLLCPTNQDALYFNQFIRTNILERTKIIEAGDLLMISRNNYQVGGGKLDFLANGEFVEVKEVQEEETLGDFRFLNLILRLPDYPRQPSFRTKILLETLLSSEASLNFTRSQELFRLTLRKYGFLKSRTKQFQAVRKDPYLNALQVKFAYALTCHKAQGGQWDAVFVQQGFWQQEPFSAEKIRWLYTAFTRAVKELYLLDAYH